MYISLNYTLRENESLTAACWLLADNHRELQNYANSLMIDPLVIIITLEGYKLKLGLTSSLSGQGWKLYAGALRLYEQHKHGFKLTDITMSDL